MERIKKETRNLSQWADVIFIAICYITVFLFAITIIVPFWTVLMDSFSGSNIKQGIRMLPDNFSLAAYKSVFEQKTLAANYGNTIFRAIVGTLLCLGMTYFAAYPLSKKKLPFNKLITYMVLFTMYFSGGLIPQYLLFKQLGFIDNRLVLILPSMFNGFYILVMRNFIMDIPKELEESALLDGANDLQIAIYVYFPLLYPIFATITLWAIVAMWNEWFTAMIYIQSSNKQVMQVLLRRMLIEARVAALFDDNTMVVEQTEDAVKAVTIYVTIIPIICTYPFVQKYFIRGLTSGAVKG